VGQANYVENTQRGFRVFPGNHFLKNFSREVGSKQKPFFEFGF
jgi:hypothetical protein